MSLEPNEIEKIFNAALEIKSDKERSAYLDGACDDNPELRSSVEKLLSAHEAAGSFLEGGTPGAAVTLDMDPIESTGTVIGRYKLLQQIGEGGFGVVYMADQEHPIRRRVALKIIKLGMDTKQVVARFEAERQALALMDHPNIAKVLDAGATDTGRPYFVMELVKGIPITEYCDKNNLDMRQRLELFIDVCNAVQHAHQKGIIHRDIKPSNVMVTLHDGKPIPKVIDFGIAKATQQRLTEKTLFTEYKQFVGTPEYMSPEQAEMSGLDVDTRTDIYSLGVLLYELLTGTTPFGNRELRSAAFDEIRRIIREDEPPRPSTCLSTLGESLDDVAKHRKSGPSQLHKMVRGELDWIVMMTLEKDRTRRYETANELAKDIQRHLSDEPVVAGPPSTAYRLSKFVRRNRTLATTVSAVATAIVLGLIVSTAMYFQAEEARGIAEQATEKEVVARSAAEEARSIAEQAEKVAQERAEEYRRSLYINRINLADVAHRDGNSGLLRTLLDACPEDLRGWEWDHLNYISDQAVMTLSGGQDAVYSIAPSPDGKRIASAGADGTIKIWDAAKGTELMTLGGHEVGVMAVRFSPDGKRIVSVSRDMKIKVWDAQSGAELKTLLEDFSRYGDFMEDVLPIPIAFSPDSKKIASMCLGSPIKVVDADSGTVLKTFSEYVGFLTGLVFTPDGKRIVSSSSGKDTTLRVWDAITGVQIMALKGHQGIILNIAISPDGRRIASVSLDRTARVWDMITGSELMTIQGIGSYARAVAFSKDGTRIATGDKTGKIKVWDAASGTELTTLLGHLGAVRGIAFSPDDERIVSGSSDGTVKIWDLGFDRTEPVTMDRRYNKMAFSPDGKHIVTTIDKDRSIRILDAATHDELMKIDGPVGRIDGPAGRGVLFSPDASRIISGSVSGNDIDVWDASSGRKLATLSGHEDSIWSMSYSPDSTRIASGGKDRTVRVWDAITGAEIMTLRGHGYYQDYPTYSPVSSVAFSSDGELIVSGSYDSTVKIWNAKTGAEVMTMSGHTDLVSDVAFSPDGKRFASASSDNTIRICDVATGDELLVLRGHEDEALSVAFSPDAKRIASGSKDDTVRIWDAATGALMQILPIHGWVWQVCFSPDGKTLVTTSLTAGRGSNQTVTLWESAAPTGGYESRKTTATARKIVDALYDNYGLYYDVIDELKADKALDQHVSKVALQIANSRRYEDAEKLTNEGWGIVSSPYKDVDAYKSILQKAQKVKDFEPDNWSILRTLGVAQYRAGFYDQALVTLRNAAKIRIDNHLEPDDANVAFTAMTLYRLDRTQEAQESIEKLYGLLKEIMWQEKWYYPCLIEAEKLFAGQNTELYLAWEHIENEQYDQALQLVKQLRSLKAPESIAQIERAIKYLGRAYYKIAAESGGRNNTYTQMFTDYQAVIAIDPEHAGALNALAWMLVTSPIEDLRDIKKAVEYATKSCELTDWNKHDQLSTLAVAYSETGNFQEAIKWQKKALELLGEDELDKWQANYQERLKLYESGKSYLTDSRWNFSKGELVSWWKLDESREGIVVDASRNGLDGKLVGDAKIISDPQRGNVLSLDGDGDYVDCGNNSAFNITGSITMAAWIKVNKFDRDWQAIVTKGYENTWWLCREGDSNSINIYGYQVKSGYSGYEEFDVTVGLVADNVNVNDGRWHHVAGVYDGTKIYLYIDGVLFGSEELYGRFAINNDPVYIGDVSTEQAYGWNGLIDDVRIYSYALSPEEIEAIYNGKEPTSAEN